ncbi:MAG: phospholipase D family protein [Pseudomonadota bacterium]
MTGILRVCLVVLLAGLLSACATLKTDVPRVASHARAPDPAVPLGRLADRLADPPGPRFRLLESGRAALAARMALAEQARQTLDLQYYLFHDDVSGRLLVDALLRAADRGVRVRVLLDDVDTAENELAIIGLDAHKNIQIRLYNPFTVRGNAPLGRALEFLGDKDRLNRRMHNKLFLADNHFGIAGGRNIGDEYFQVEHEVAFRDLDVLALGTPVRAMSRAFDAYWNSEHSVPARALPHDGPRRFLLRGNREALEAHRREVAGRMAEYLSLDALGPAPAPGLGPWTAGEAELLLDDPDKTAGQADAKDLPLTRLLRLGDQARKELLIASPYFVPGRLGTDFLAQLRQRGVRVRILTNSLAANDVAVVHAGYARYRPPLLLAGVELHELKPVKQAPLARFVNVKGSSRASLHSKALVVDRQVAYVGSMNLDPRSALLNTESGLILRSPELAEQVARYIESDMGPTRSYRVKLDPDSPPEVRSLLWLDQRRDGETIHRVEPEVGLTRRLLIDALGLLPIEGDL